MTLTDKEKIEAISKVMEDFKDLTYKLDMFALRQYWKIQEILDS